MINNEFKNRISRRSRVSKRNGLRSGAATVELAVITPMLLAILLGMFELGQCTNATSTLTAAVREAGRLGCMDFKDLTNANLTANQKIERDLKNFLLAAGLPANNVTVTITHAEGSQMGQTFDVASPANYLQLFKVTATLPYSQVNNYPKVFMAGRDLKASIVFRRGRVIMTN